VFSQLQEYRHAWNEFKADAVHESSFEREERKMSMIKAFNLMKLLKKDVDAEDADGNVQ
jgi:hypothetical protein